MSTKHPVLLGWAFLALGLATMFASVWLFPIYGLLYVGAFVFAVQAMRRQRVVAGIVLLVMLLAVSSLWMLLTVYRGAMAVDHENRGEWHDDSARGRGGWFEIGSRADLPTAHTVDFTWNDVPDDEGGVPRRGVFTRH